MLKKIIHISILVLLNIGVISSQTETVDSLPAEQVEVLKQFDAIISDVEAMLHSPTVSEEQYPPLSFNYLLEVEPLDLEYPPPLIRPIAMKPDAPGKMYNGLFKLAAGTSSSFFADAKYQYRIDRYYNIGLSFQHYSAKEEEIYNKKYSTSSGGLDLGYYINDLWKANFSGSFGHRRNYFYAFQDTEIPFDSTARRDRQLLDLSFSIGNEAEGNKDKSLLLGIDYYLLNLKDEPISENGFNLYLEGSTWLTDEVQLDLLFGTEFTIADTLVKNFSRYYFNPALKLSPKKWKLKLGAKLEKSNDETVILPDANFQLSLIDSKLNAIGGAVGNYHVQSFKTQSDWNPYFYEGQDSLRFTKSMQFYLGANGLINKLNFEARVGYEITDNQLLWVNGFLLSEPRKFLPVWDNFNTIFFELSAAMKTLAFLELESRIRLNFYDQEFEEEAWHLPAFKVDLGAVIKLFDDKLDIRPMFSFSEPLKYENYFELGPNLQPTVGDTNAKIDLSLEASYAVHPQAGIYLRATNLFNNKHEAFYDYEGFGVQVQGGVKARF